MRFAAGIVFYEDMGGLARLCRSIHRGFDYMFLLDGKYPRRPGKSNLSMDGSRDIVSSYPNAKLYDCPWPEFDKRSYYLQLCQEFGVDYLVILDTDEYAERDDAAGWQQFRDEVYDLFHNRYKGAHIMSIYIQLAARYYDDLVRKNDVWLIEDNIEYGHYPRIWYQPYAMEYFRGSHYHYRMKDPRDLYHKVAQVPSFDVVKSIKFRHDHQLRSPDHQEARRQYQTWLIEHEGKSISTWREQSKP